MSELPHVLTWAALLAKWTDFARSALALPGNEEGARLRASVPALIGLQAVTHALSELDQLPQSERPVGLDRAEVLIIRYNDELAGHWGVLPEAIAEVVSDARAALGAARNVHSPRVF